MITQPMNSISVVRGTPAIRVFDLGKSTGANGIAPTSVRDESSAGSPQFYSPGPTPHSNVSTDSRREQHVETGSELSRSPHIEIPPGTSLEDVERAAVEMALQVHRGNRTHAAKTLGISVRTLQRKLKAWRISSMSLRPAARSPEFSFASVR